MRIFSNEESTANALASVGLDANYTAWRDALHVGRVTPVWNLSAFASDRAEVYQEFGWDEDDVFEKDMQLRNEELQDAIDSDEDLVLLFDPGLEDQLQLCQIVGWIATQSPQTIERLKASPIEKSLSEYAPEAVAGFVDQASVLTVADVELFRSAWLAIISPDPRFLERFLANDHEGAKYEVQLKRAIIRLLREYPSSENGLSLSECQILDGIRLGIQQPQPLFEACREAEAFPFFNNWEFWMTLDGLCSGEGAFLRIEGRDRFLCPPRDLAWTDFYEQRLQLTERGEQAFGKNSGFVSESILPRWICGVEINAENLWFWDYASQSLVRESNSLAEV